MEKLVLLGLFALVAAAYGYTNEQAAAFADSDKDGFISDKEFEDWHTFALYSKKTETLFAFTGPIPVGTFAYVLWDWQDKGSFPSNYSVWDAVDYANEDGNDFIDAVEFDKWYSGVVYYSAQLMKKAMAGEDGVITVQDFVNVLNAITM